MREVPSKKIFTATELLLKVVCQIVYIQRTIPDNIILNPYAGEKIWSRKESVRNRHIKLFKDSVDDINDRILKNNSKCLYTLEGESLQLVGFDTGLEIPEEESGIQETNDNQTPKHDQDKSGIEFWNKRSHRIAVAGVVVAILILFFGDGILKPLFPDIWDYLRTLL